MLFNKVGYKAHEVYEMYIDEFYPLWNHLLIAKQEEDYANKSNFAFLATHLSNMLCGSKKNMSSVEDLIGEFKPIGLFNVKHISDSTKKYIKMLDEKGIKYKLLDDEKVEILQNKGN